MTDRQTRTQFRTVLEVDLHLDRFMDEGHCLWENVHNALGDALDRLAGRYDQITRVVINDVDTQAKVGQMRIRTVKVGRGARDGQ